MENNESRYNIVTNINSQVNKVIKAGLNLHLSNINTTENTGANLNIFKAPPWQPIYDKNGPRGFAPVGKGTFKPNPNYDPSLLNAGSKYIFATGPTPLWGPQQISNAIAQQAYSNTSYNNQLMIGKAYLQVEPLTGLEIKGTVSGNYYIINSKVWNNNDAWLFSQRLSNPYSNQNGTSVGSLQLRYDRTINLNGALNVKYIHSFGKNNINLMFNYSRQHYYWNTRSSGSSQLPYSRKNLRYFAGIKPYTRGIFRQFQDYSLIGYLVRISYNYGHTYYVVLTGRRQGSSRFAPDHRWGIFPAFSAGWRITNEDFMQNISWLNNLKIRVGYGELGNQQTTAGFAYLVTAKLTPHYSLGSGNGDGLGVERRGAFLPNFPNKLLSWEKVYTGTIGFDASMFRNRFSITVNYYHRNTDGIIQAISLPLSAGIEQSIDVNVASVVNRGFEFKAGYQDTFWGKLGFSFSGNLTTVHNEVTKLYNGVPLRGGGLAVGRPIGFIYGYKMGGIFQNKEQIAQWKKNHTDKVGAGNPQPGDIYFKDLYGPPTKDQKAYEKSAKPDGIINSYDRTYLGSTIPAFYYGFNFGLNYHNFDLSLFFQGVGKVMQYNTERRIGEAMSSNGVNQWAATLNRWTPDHHSTTMPRAVYADPNANNRYSDRYVENAAYLRLQTVQLGYSFPFKLLHSTGFIRNLRIYVRGVNLFTVTDWSGLDPENNVYPSTRQFVGGINVSF